MVHSKIIRFEEEIRDLPRERSAVFSTDGEKILERESIIVDLCEVCAFDDSEYERMHNQILTHNHPSRLLFGIKDITLAVDAQLAELRVVTVKGTFSLKPTLGRWPEAKTIFTKFKEVEGSWDYIPEREKEFQESGKREKLNAHLDHDWYMQHLIWKIVAERLGLMYIRNEWELIGNL